MLLYLGKNYQLHVLFGAGTSRFRLVRREFIVTLKASSETRADSKRLAKKLYQDWLMDRGEKVFPAKVKYYAKKVGLSPRRIIIKNLRKRWGSATAKGVLNPNMNLLKAPEDVIDYVVLHELCHLRERNHSHRFWSLLSTVMPDYKEKVGWLSVNALGLVE